MSFIQNASCNTFTLIFVIALITCSASIDCLGQQQFGRNNDHFQVVDQQAQHNSLNPTITHNNQPAIDQIDNNEQLKQVIVDANLGQLIRSTRAREEVASSGAFMEPKRRRSKRLQLAKDELSAGEFQINQQQREEKAKQALRKRWHKLADDIIDDVFANQQHQQQQQQRHQLNDGNSMKLLDSSYKKKKWFTKQQQQREDDSDNGFEKITLLMKKPLSESADSDVMNAGNSNNLLLTSQPQPTMLMGGANEAIGIQKPSQYSQSGDSNVQSLNSIRKPNVNMQEHARRILDDKFGVMKESIFTTNNHLGLKGVPKFGSDEEY